MLVQKDRAGEETNAINIDESEGAWAVSAERKKLLKSKSKSKAKAKSKSHASKAKAASSKAKTKTSGGAGVSLTTIVESIKGVGQSEPVTITWYVRVEYRERPGCSMCFQVYWTRPLEP